MQTTYKFGPVEVRPWQRALLINNAPVSLSGRAFDLLVALIERAGRLVTKDELLDAVWGRIVVEEGNLHVHVSALRKLLGADMISTIPGRGYCFAPSIDADSRPPPPVAAPRSTEHVERANALIGRDHDLAALTKLLDEHRLVTLTGPGGIGKTRLARAALDARRSRHADGVVRVELAALTDAALIPGAIAAALQLPFGASGDTLAALAAATRSLRILILLDNAEHLVDGVAAVASALLAEGDSHHLLVTSQMPLKLDGERVYRLTGLAVPEPAAAIDAEAALSCGAIALFSQRVQAADRHFRLSDANVGYAINICRQLDGIALAIELAAARCPLLGLAMVSQRLDERFSLLRAGSRTAPTRQQTLQAAMDWSHALLSSEQQVALRHLGVFSGGFTLGLARQVLSQEGIDEWGAIDLLADLVDRSLVSVEGDELPRYRLLETGRAYALAKLADAGEEQIIRARHAQAVHALFEQAYEDCWQIPEAAFVARYETELGNLRAALDWSLQHDAQTAVALAGASARLWRGLSLHPEALRRCALTSVLINEHTPPPLAGRLWEAVAQLSGETSSTQSRSAAQHAVTWFEKIDDRRGIYLALAHLAFSYRTDTPEARAAFARMQSLEDPRWPAAVRLMGAKVEGGLASHAHSVDAARRANQRRLALATTIGSDRDIFAAMGNLADVALIGGDAPEAVRLGRALLERLGRRHRVTRVIALGNLLLALLASGDVGAGRVVATEFVDLVSQLDFMYVSANADALALFSALERRFAAAAQLLGYADAAFLQDQQQREPNEAQARERCLTLLESQCEPAALIEWLAQGAQLQAEAACAVALQAA